MQLYHEVFPPNEADAAISGWTAGDGERDNGHVVGGRVAGEDAETAQRRADCDGRRRRGPVPDVDHVSHVVGGVHVTTGDVRPRAASRPRRKHALRLGPTEHVCSQVKR